ncbi:hypothetical protein PybrP1_012852 [[Pythium] brassicae (nom. inval.)]|nr:hypothetical protein PybrP1_012852 [[Pythium] brassicae (nom. inval.)]
MGERKVLNKYFPPDFDPSLVPRRKRPKNEQIEVRMMLPFSLQCATCGEYMYRGKKFNSRKEEVADETYHGIRIFRFYIKCITCAAEITFRTDPARGDYAAEHGCVRNFEPWREREDEEDAAAAQREDEERGDAMKALENRTLDSKREMDILDALDEIKAINQRHARVDTDALLRQHAAGAGDDAAPTPEALAAQLQEDLRQAKLAFQHKKPGATGASAGGNTAAPAGERRQEADGGLVIAPSVTTHAAAAGTAVQIAVVVKKKKKLQASDSGGPAKKKQKKKQQAPAPAPTSLVAQYSDSD